MQQDAQPHIDRNVRRTVGVAALRKIQQLLAQWEYEERRDRRIALLLGGGLVFVVVLLAAFAFYMISPQLVPIN